LSSSPSRPAEVAASAPTDASGASGGSRAGFARPSLVGASAPEGAGAASGASGGSRAGFARPSLLGLGVELVSVPRFEAALARHGERLSARVFRPAEVAYARRRGQPGHSLAARFAAKVAARRALAGALGGRPWLRDVEVVRRRSGEPTLLVHGPTAGTPGAAALRLTLTLTHDAEFALASVFAERVAGSRA
jgi:holo-[acyl-carrier protein] synthase